MAANKLEASEVSQQDELVAAMNANIETQEKALADGVPFTNQSFMTIRALFGVLVTEAESFRDEVASRLREEWDEKSERWQESDRGQEVGDFIDSWESADFSSFEDDLNEEPRFDDMNSIVEELQGMDTAI